MPSDQPRCPSYSLPDQLHCQLTAGHLTVHTHVGGVVTRHWSDAEGYDPTSEVQAAYQRGLAEGSEWAGLSLGYEDEQWSVWWREGPGHGLNVTVPTDDEADHEAAVRAFQAEHGGEIKRRRRVSLVGQWTPIDQPEAPDA